LLVFALAGGTLAAGQVEGVSLQREHSTVLKVDDRGLTLSFEAPELQNQLGGVEEQGGLILAGEGTLLQYGEPMLPMISRFVVVPADVIVELEYHSDAPRTAEASNPVICLDEGFRSQHGMEARGEFFPPAAAEVSEPFIIRGVRLVRVTVYPVQYDEANQNYIYNNHITTELHFRSGEAVNSVSIPRRKHRSQEFLRFIRALAVNAEDIGEMTSRRIPRMSGIISSRRMRTAFPTPRRS